MSLSPSLIELTISPILVRTCGVEVLIVLVDPRELIRPDVEITFEIGSHGELFQFGLEVIAAVSQEFLCGVLAVMLETNEVLKMSGVTLLKVW